MDLDLISAFRATANDDEYNVQIKSAYPIENHPYKKEYGGGDSFEVMERNMIVTINFISGEATRIMCDRMIEEFDKLLCIKNFKQTEFDLQTVESIVVK